jgi:HPt (histidine-containing phosphotransfer) domain-containing protein
MPEDEERLAGIRDRIEAIIDPDPAPAEVALILRLLRSFTTKTPAAIDRLLDDFGDKDLAALRDQAHALKGSAANIGATGLAALCSDVEDQARAGVVADPAGMPGKIRAEAAAALRAVSALADEYSRPFSPREPEQAPSPGLP